MAETDTDTDTTGPTDRRFEIVATVLLGLAALATAWSGYQASLWDGIQSSDYTQASGLRTRASLAHTEANQVRLADLSIFENYVDALIDGDAELTAFYRDRFRPEFEVAFDAWEAEDPLNNPDVPASPLGMDEYRLAQDDEYEDLTRQAEATFERGEQANNYSDAYTATTLFFAASLFFAAISERFEYRRARIALLGMATIGLVLGFVVAVTQPITSG